METVVVVEHIVDHQLGFQVVATGQMPSVGSFDVEQEIGVDGIAFAAGVVGILFAHIFSDKLNLGIPEGDKGGNGSTHYRGRESQVGGAGNGGLLGVTVLEDKIGQAKHLILTKRQVGIGAEPVAETIATFKFDTDAIALVHIFHQCISGKHIAVGGHLVFVEHGIEIGIESPTALGYLVAQFKVEHGLMADGVTVGVGTHDVETHRLAAVDAGHEIGTLVIVDTVVDTQLGIEEEVIVGEIESAVKGCAGQYVVAIAIDTIVDHAQLKVGIGIEVGIEVVGGLGIDRVVELGALVVVPTVGQVEMHRRVAIPKHIAELVTIVVDEIVAKRESELVAAIVDSGIAGVGIIVHALLEHHVAHIGEGGRHIAAVGGHILLVVSATVHHVEGTFEAPAVAEQVRHVELIVALPVVVGLVVVVHGAPIHIVFASRIIRRVGIQLVGIGTIPSYTCLLIADDGKQFDQRALTIPTYAAEETLLVGAPRTDETIGGETAVGKVEREAALQYSCTCTRPILARIPRAESNVGHSVRLVTGIDGLHVDSGTHSRAAACRSTHASLNLHALRHPPQVGYIVPENLLAFGIVQCDAVEVHIDTVGLNAAYADVGAADGAILAASHHRRLRLKHVGNAQFGAGFVQLLAVQSAGGERGLVAHSHILDDHLIELAQGVHALCVHLGAN